ncbi:cyclic nucleotide-binding domain-containing protein [Myxococcota bacterium]|nr:cyclic nucleotide-binding domain-containing protein [Myxococcota bacterium]
MQDKQVKATISNTHSLQLFSTLRQAPRLRSYPDLFMEQLASLGHAVRVPEGFELLSEGTYNDYVYLLLKGSVRLQSKNKIFFHLHQTGEIFGEGALLMEEPGRETAIASTQSELLRLPVQELSKLQQDPSLREPLLRFIAHSQQDKFQRLLRSPTGGDLPHDPQTAHRQTTGPYESHATHRPNTGPYESHATHRPNTASYEPHTAHRPTTGPYESHATPRPTTAPYEPHTAHRPTTAPYEPHTAHHQAEALEDAHPLPNPPPHAAFLASPRPALQPSFGEISYEDLAPSAWPRSPAQGFLPTSSYPSASPNTHAFAASPPSPHSPPASSPHHSAPQLHTILPLLPKSPNTTEKRALPISAWSNHSSEAWGFIRQMQSDLLLALDQQHDLLHKLNVTQINSWQRALLLELQRTQQALQTHLNDLFAISAIENKEALFHQHAFSLEQVLSELFAPLREISATRGIYLQYACAPHTGLYRKGDPLQLTRILSALLQTSIGWTAQGEVVLWVEPLPQAPDWLRFSLRDTSPGLPPEQASQIFSRYHPAESPPHSGLSLALAQRLSQAMGGQLTFESHPQQGAHFLLNLCLPIHLTRPTAHATHVDLSTHILPPHSSVSTADLDLIPPPDYLRPLKQARTLIIDPNPESAALTRHALQSIEISPDIAADPTKALHRFSQQTYDIVFLCPPIPNTETWELSAKLQALHRAQEHPHPLHTVALLQQPPSSSQHTLLQQHHDAWLLRPLQKQDLLQTLQELWKGRQIMTRQGNAPPSPSKASLTAQFDALLQRYIANLHQRVERLREALHANDLQEVRHIGHKLKGSGSSYGFDQITEIGRQMEIAGEQNDATASAQLIDELERTLQSIEEKRPNDPT